MKNFDSEFEKSEKRFNSMFKVAVGFIVCVFFVVMAVWGTIAYVAVTKGPETVHRIERIGDAFADKLEQENKNNKKSE